MRAQTTLEFMLYTLVSVSALVAVVYAYQNALPAFEKSENIGYVEELISMVNLRLGGNYAQFDAYVPKAICNTTVEDGYAEIYGDKIVLDANVKFLGSLCNYSGLIRTVTLSYHNGSYLVG